jgi:hypothetical protein
MEPDGVRIGNTFPSVCSRSMEHAVAWAHVVGMAYM